MTPALKKLFFLFEKKIFYAACSFFGWHTEPKKAKGVSWEENKNDLKKKIFSELVNK